MMPALRFIAKGLSRRHRRCPELQLYAVAAVVIFGAITFAEMIAGPLIARQDRAKTTEDVAVCVDVLDNDEHLEGKAFSPRIDTYPPTGRGTAEIHDKCIDYDPAGNFDALAEGETATVTLDYSIVDDDGRDASAQLTVTIEGKKTSGYGVGGALDRLAKCAIKTPLVTAEEWPPTGRENGNGVRDPCPCTTLPTSDVRKLQEALSRNGVEPGPIDGICGPQTCRAFAEWLELPRPGAGLKQKQKQKQKQEQPPISHKGGDSLCWLPGLMQFFATGWDPINRRPHVGWLASGYTADSCVVVEEKDELWRVGLENDRFVDEEVSPIETSTAPTSPTPDQARHHHERRGPGMHTHQHERKRHHGKGSRGKKKRY